MAYYDDRNKTNINIRLFSINTFVQNPKTDCMYCKLWKNNSTFYYTSAEQNRIAFRTISKQRYISYTYSCPVYDLLPLNMALCLNSTVCSEPIKVKYTDKPKQPLHDFGVCVRALNGFIQDNNIDSMVEWFEFHQLLGVTEFNLYNSSVASYGSKMKSLFEYYKTNNILQFHQMQWSVPYNRESDKEEIGEMLQEASITDCMYSNMYRYQRLIVLDLDEIIIPKQAANYYELIQNLTSSDNKFANGHIHFWADNYFQTLPENNTYPSVLKTMRYQFYVVSNYRPKSMYNPRLCKYANCHFCLDPRDGNS